MFSGKNLFLIILITLCFTFSIVYNATAQEPLPEEVLPVLISIEVDDSLREVENAKDLMIAPYDEDEVTRGSGEVSVAVPIMLQPTEIIIDEPVDGEVPSYDPHE